MPRTSHGLPGIYNATPITLNDGDGAAPALNASGQIIAAAPSGSSSNQVQGAAAHDAAATAINPVLSGGYASAAAPSDVSGDGDAVRAWFLRNGAQAIALTAAGALIGGDATNGLDVDVTRVTGTVATSSAQLPSGLSADRLKIVPVTDAGASYAGDAQGIKMIIQPPTVAAAAAPTNATSTAYEASRLIKASAGIVWGLTGYNSKASAQFIQLFNSTTVPADTAVPVVVVTVPATSNFSVDFGRFGRYFSTGVAIANSSTGPTKTVGSADCWFDVQYS